jgi:ABC-type glycerol-3-phosphate transport system permease component
MSVQTQQQPMSTSSIKNSPFGHWLHRWDTILIQILLIALCLIVLFPIVYTILTSLRPKGYGLSLEIVPRDGFYFDHYVRLLSTPRFLRNILNSAINSLGGATATTVVAAMAGYAFGRFKFPGRTFLLFFILAMMMLPGLTNLIPIYKLASDLGILDTYVIMILVYGAYGVPFGIWVMMGFFKSIPRVLEEAAAVDGATPIQTFIYVVLPISLPGLIAVFMINFVYNFNDFLTALILLSSTAMKTATVGLFDFQNQLTGNNNELLNAACVLIMIPGILLFLVSRRAFLKGMVEGAVKG